MNLAATLAHGVAQLDPRVGIDARGQAKLLDYLALLQKWNRTYNLTAIRDPDKMVSHHLLDSLAVAPHIGGGDILDVGSGAGLPGIPLAVVLPGSRVTLLDASHKKAAFLRQAAIELELPNVEVACARAEEWSPGKQYRVVISRAFSDLAGFLAAAGHHCAADGMLVAMKGVYPDEEIAQLPAGFRLKGAVPLTVPGLAAERHLVTLEPAGT